MLRSDAGDTDEILDGSHGLNLDPFSLGSWSNSMVMKCQTRMPEKLYIT